MWHDQPHVYPVMLRCRWLTGYVRATPRHVALGGWRTADHDLLAGYQQPYWEGAGLDVYTETLGRLEERGLTDARFTAATHSGRLGEFGIMHDRAAPPATPYSELLLPTWLAVTAGVVPFGVVVVGRIRRGDRAVQGYCRVCGYDLRATTGRCPECGTPVPAKPAPAPLPT